MWELILTIALKLLGLTVDRIQDNKEMKSLFLQFVEAQASRLGNSVAVHDAYEAQKKALQDAAAKEKPQG